MRLFILALLYFAPGLRAGAQSLPPPAPALTVDEAVTLALRNNPRLSAAAGEVVAAQSGVRAARARANPDITFTPGFTSGGSDEELRVQQPLELNGTRQARTGVARAGLRGTQARAVVELRDVVFDTKSAYYELARARELHALAGDLLRSAEEFDRVARRQVELGSRPGIDLAQTGIEATRARQQVTLAQSQETVALAALNTLLSRAPEEPLGPLAPLPAATESVDEAGARATALAARAEIAVEEAARDQFRQEARLARAEGRPDLAPLFRADSLTRSGGRSGFGVGITLPLLDWGGRRARIRQAEASARAQEDRVAVARNQVRQEVAQALARLRADQTVIESYQQGVLDQARRLLDASRVGFLEGKTGVVALLEAQRTYRNVQTEYTNALVDAAVARAQVEQATGAVPATLVPAAPGADQRGAK